MDYFDALHKFDNNKYLIAAAAITASLSKDNLVTELGTCYPNLYKNDLMQIVITTATMFIFVRDLKISVQAALILYVVIFMIHKLSKRTDCITPAEETLKEIARSLSTQE